MIALLLAQLVLPSPPSGPIQPPGMICASGDCSGGPVVYRTSQRGRLVVACDMRSDTCSDGRQIVTERATPVPCETSPGVWEIVPEDTACISWRGLESWAQTTSCLSWGAELDRSPWVASSSGASLEPLSDGWRINKAEGGLAGWRQDVAGGAEDTYTSTCIVRGAAPGTRVYVASGTFCTVDIASEDWGQVSCTRAVTGTNHFLGVYPCGNTDPACSLDVKACWYTKTDTPGRACWGGEAPVTCAGDRHTISTEGWPTEAGRIDISFVAPSPLPPRDALILDTRTANGAGFVLYIAASGRLESRSDAAMLTGPLVTPGQAYAVRMSRSEGIVRMHVNGALGGEQAMPPWSHRADAVLGRRFTAISGETYHLNGSLSSFAVRSFEE